MAPRRSDTRSGWFNQHHFPGRAKRDPEPRTQGKRICSWTPDRISLRFMRPGKWTELAQSALVDDALCLAERALERIGVDDRDIRGDAGAFFHQPGEMLACAFARVRQIGRASCR